MICPVCGKSNMMNNFHFEKGRNPTKYMQCNNPKCNNKGKEVNISFSEILRFANK